MYLKLLYYAFFCRADTEEQQASFLSNSTDSKHSTETRQRNIGVYCALVLGTFLLAFAGSGMCFYIALSASQKLHNQMFEKLLGATIYFFDTNPVGKYLQMAMGMTICWVFRGVSKSTSLKLRSFCVICTETLRRTEVIFRNWGTVRRL